MNPPDWRALCEQEDSRPLPDQPEVRPEAPWLRRLPLRSPTLAPATHTNTYLIGEGELLVVDPASPYPEEQQRLVAALDALAAQGCRVAALFLTHHHGDHCGGVNALRQALAERGSDAPLLAHSITARRVGRRRLQVDQWLDEGATLPFGPQGLTVLHTPGHAPGHLCLHDRAAGALVVGDMVASVGTIVIDPEDDGDMAAYLEQLARLQALAGAGARRLWPAHGASVEDGVALLGFYQAHRLQREGKIVAALAAAGPRAPLAVLLARAYDDVPEFLHPLAERALLAHLIKLVREGRVVGADQRYSLVTSA